jgi:hypothetical protein
MRWSVILLVMGCDGALMGGRAPLSVVNEPAPAVTPPSPPGTPPVRPTPPSLASPPGLMLLTKQHIRSTLTNQFSISSPALTWNEPSLGLFESNRLATAHVFGDVEGALSAMERLVAAHLDRLLTCPRAALDVRCLEQTVRSVGKRLFRRSLTEAEVARYAAIASSQGASHFTEGAAFALVGLLSAPAFLYQPLSGVDGRLTDQELAARLGFFLTGGNPDLALIEAAERRELGTGEGLAVHVDRLLADQSANGERFARVMAEAWRVTHADASLTATSFPTEFEALAPLLTEEFRRTALEVHRTGDLRGVATLRRTVVNRPLAQHYEFSTLPSETDGWVSVALDQRRTGLLTNGLTLAAHSGSKYTSTIHRGLFAVNQLLCRTIPTPVDLQALVSRSGITLDERDSVRERVARVGSTQPCASCHNQFDPAGLAFEHFDGLGRWSSVRWGAPVDARATVDGVEVADLAALGSVLVRDEERFASCFAGKVYTSATGAPVPEDAHLLAAYGLEGDQRFDFDAMVRAVALHESFRTVRTP